ncbi:hypothetical protein LTR66_005038 [Elasticomyces elasticus]|nr:hypothetical protein LTR66_005038 [Elasticomyces elasticus]
MLQGVLYKANVVFFEALIQVAAIKLGKAQKDALQSEFAALSTPMKIIPGTSSRGNVNGLPASVLFLPGKRLTDEAFRWAPANLMDLRIIGNDINAQAIVTPRSLYVSYPGFTLSQLEYPASCVIACKIDGETFFIRRSLLNGTLPWEDLHLHTRKNLSAIILAIKGLAKKQSSGAVVEGLMKKDASGIETALGALVERQERAHENERYVSYLRYVSVVKKGSFADKYPNVPWSSKEIEEKERTPGAGTYLPDGQSWRVN